VHVDEQSLRGGAGRSDLPIDTVKRLTCDGSLLTIVEDADGSPLDVGRKKRTVSTALCGDDYTSAEAWLSGCERSERGDGRARCGHVTACRPRPGNRHRNCSVHCTITVIANVSAI
jgi:hypothetical protein